MSQSEIILEGTLHVDGTLTLDEKPTLPPGRVQVVLRQEAEPTSSPQEDWWQFMQRARRELEQSGASFMNQEQVENHIDWLREEDRIDHLLRPTNRSE